jgi:lipopolysaccharide transport system ATP-binding protein
MREMVVARGLSKTYRLDATASAYKVLREQIVEFARRGFRRRTADPSLDFQALQDVDFSIGDGEIVGLIGKNGAGKSTLLKILSRITEPTSGEVHLFGKVASLLEVGIGFHPELTGRENVYLNGAILGMSRAEIRRKFDPIVQFAEIDRFLDTPVKRYSSGMYVRLAFAVAAHLEPDILVVDEVLAVGDAAFQQKCLGKMRDIREEGRTVIVVSHNMATVTSLCQRALWLDQGRVRGIGPAGQIVSRYLSQDIKNDLVWSPRHPSQSEFEYHAVSVVRGDTGEAVESLPADAPIDVVYDFTIVGKFSPSRLIMKLRNELSETLFTSTSADNTSQHAHAWREGRQTIHCRIPANLLTPGRYSITVNHPFATYDVFHENILTFTVNEQNSVAARDGREGKIAPILEWLSE